MRDKKYNGDYSVAITKFRKAYEPRIDSNARNLALHLESEEKILGLGYKVLRIYHNVNTLAIEVLRKITNQLQEGKRINLERVLG